jgi:hypothetical protein
MTDRVTREAPKTKEEALLRINSYANRGTFRQFYTEMSAKMNQQKDIDVVLEGNTMTFCRLSKEGGIFGIGAKTIRQPVLELSREGTDVHVNEETMDMDFLLRLAALLRPH